MKKSIRGIMAFLCFTVGSHAFAVGDGFYLGVQGGTASMNYESSVIPGPPPNTITPDTSNNAFKLLAGYQFSQYGAFEMGYTYFSAVNFTSTFPISTGKPSSRIQTVDLLGKGIFPIQNFSVFAKLGGAVASIKTSGSVSNFYPSGYKVRPAGAIGADFAYQNWVIDLTANHIFGSSGNVPTTDFYALGIAYHFADLYCGQFLC